MTIQHPHRLLPGVCLIHAFDHQLPPQTPTEPWISITRSPTLVAALPCATGDSWPVRLCVDIARPKLWHTVDCAHDLFNSDRYGKCKSRHHCNIIFMLTVASTQSTNPQSTTKPQPTAHTQPPQPAATTSLATSWPVSQQCTLHPCTRTFLVGPYNMRPRFSHVSHSSLLYRSILCTGRVLTSAQSRSLRRAWTKPSMSGNRRGRRVLLGWRLERLRLRRGKSIKRGFEGFGVRDGGCNDCMSLTSRTGCRA